MILIYVDLGLYADVKRIWKHYKPQIIVGIIMFCVNVLNFFVPVSYVITEQNMYERRPLSYIYYFVILYYCLSALYITRRYEKENGAHAFFSIDMFLFPILVGAGLQFLFYGLSLAWLSSAVGLVGLFMMQQNEMAYVDSLSDTYNRQYLNSLLASWMSKGYRFAGAMIDIDNFKRINDAYGHSEGDQALKNVADILKRARRDHEWVFRFAGDEFIVLKKAASKCDIRAYMAEVEKALDAYNQVDMNYRLGLSYGTSEFDHGSIDAFMKEMDDNMYAMKEEHHKRERGQG